ncbi:MAG: peptidylprolyl isomerase A [Phycisphaera sp.]|nr:peptidylprolyl isomerase A [Phycisphaera sp.]
MTSRSRLATILSIVLLIAFAPVAFAAQYAVVDTSDGAFVIELDDQKAPISVANFEQYAKDGFYANTVFHRVIPGFMIQGGGFDHHGNYPNGLHNKGAHQDLRPPIANEWQNGLKNTRGSIAMARLGGKPDSATTQFFINLKDNGFLDQDRDGAGYAVFGKVIAGMDVVDRIAGVPTGRSAGMSDVPTREVKIKTVRILSKEEAMKVAARAGLAAAEERVKAAQLAVAEATAELAAASKACEDLKKKMGTKGE